MHGRRAREVAFQVLYQDDLNPRVSPSVGEDLLRRRLASDELLEFGQSLVAGVRRNRGEIDAALAEGSPYALLLLDLTVPGGMGGKDAIREIKGMDPEVKAIVSSGYSNDPIMANFEEYGFLGVVLKPYKIEELSKVLQKIIAR